MAKQTDELLDHVFDGIREYDNPLPNWWLWLFYSSIAFSVFYIPYYTLGLGPSSADMYQEEIALAGAEQESKAAASRAKGGNAQSSAAGGEQSLAGNAGAIEAGKAIFATNCLPCHGDNGQGVIGPNLTDRYWLHGNRYEEIVAVITNGVLEKGMIPWKATLNPTKIRQVAAFVFSLKNSNPPNPKAPQGKEYPD